MQSFEGSSSVLPAGPGSLDRMTVHVCTSSLDDLHEIRCWKLWSFPLLMSESRRLSFSLPSRAGAGLGMQRLIVIKKSLDSERILSFLISQWPSTFAGSDKKVKTFVVGSWDRRVHDVCLKPSATSMAVQTRRYIRFAMPKYPVCSDRWKSHGIWPWLWFCGLSSFCL